MKFRILYTDQGETEELYGDYKATDIPIVESAIKNGRLITDDLDDNYVYTGYQLTFSDKGANMCAEFCIAKGVEATK